MSNTPNLEASPPRERKARPQVIFIVAALVVVIAAMRAASALIVPFLLAVFLSLLASPAVFWLKKKRVPTGASVALVVLLMLGVLGGVGLLVGSSLTQLNEAVPKYQARLEEILVAMTDWLQAKGFDVSEKRLTSAFDPGVIMGLVSGTLSSLAETLSNIVLVILTVTFILLEVTGFPAKARAAMGDADADLSRFARVARDVKRYLAYKSVVSLVTGVLAGVWTAVLGVDFPVLWGLLAFLLNYIPNLGSILAAIPPVLLAMLEFGAWRAGLVGLGYLAINMSLGNLVEPMVMGRRLGLSTLVVFVSLIFWGWLWGPVGMLLSVPLTMVVKILLENSEQYNWVAILLDSRVPEPPRKRTLFGRRMASTPYAKRAPSADSVYDSSHRKEIAEEGEGERGSDEEKQPERLSDDQPAEKKEG
jgi:predicted PurR-regulated permease PerM